MKLEFIDTDYIQKMKPKHLEILNDKYTAKDIEFITTYMFRIVGSIKLKISNLSIVDRLILTYPFYVYKDGFFIGKASKYKIEIDINTVCNLSCNNCNRFSNYKTTWYSMDISVIESFIEDNKWLGKNLTVCILGGEPTLHKDIFLIIDKLKKYFCVTIATNGVREFNTDIIVENSSKQKGVQYDFAPTMMAPKDDNIPETEYMLGCKQSSTCGLGYSELGYYACSIAKALDFRLVKEGIKNPSGANSIFTIDEYKQNKDLCGYCGSYYNSNYIQVNKKLTNKIEISNSWSFMRNKK